MKQAQKQKKASISFNDLTYQVDSRVLALFENIAGDKREAVLEQTALYLKDGRMVERALADSLDKFKLI